MAMRAQLFTLSGLATELGRDRRGIGNLLHGVPPDGKSGQWDAWYLTTVLRAMSRGADGEDALDLNAERARKAKEEADNLEMKNAQLRGELLPRDEVHVAVTSAFARVRARLLALPSKAAPLVVGSKSPAEVQSKLSAAVNEALQELAETQIGGIPVDDDADPESPRSSAGMVADIHAPA